MAALVVQGNSLHIPLKDESVDCIITSPPYWSLREYDGPSVVWDGNPECSHDWVGETKKWHSHRGHGPRKEVFDDSLQHQGTHHSFCTACGAWRGQLGLEPTLELYTKHLIEIFQGFKRILKPQGTLWVNIGDTSWTAKGSCHNPGGGRASWDSYEKRKSAGVYPLHRGNKSDMPWLPGKSLCLIPFRFALALQGFSVIHTSEILQLAEYLAEAREKGDWAIVTVVEGILRAKAFVDTFVRGWVLRSVVIWEKPNCLPSSAKNRFTNSFEYLFFFVKSNKPLYWTNEKTLSLATRKPPGTRGKEGEDWEWRQCPACSGRAYFNYRIRDALKKEKGCPQFKISTKERRSLKKRTCPRCGGTGRVKVNLWSGHDYYFNQQFEPLAESTLADSRNETGRHTQGLARGSKYKNILGHDKPSWYRSKVFVNSALGRNKRSVWRIAIKGNPKAHFAPYPPELCETPIKAGCPQLVCAKCGMPKVPVYNREISFHSGSGKSGRPPKGKWEGGEQEVSGEYDIRMGPAVSREFKGYAECSCNAGFRPGVVFDPFCGTGSTGEAAQRLSVNFIGLDLSRTYCDMSEERLATLSLL